MAVQDALEYVQTAFDAADSQFYDEPYYFEYHIKPALEIARELAKKYAANMEIVEYATSLHDIGNIDLPPGEEHDEFGAKRVRPLLAAWGLAEERIDQIAYCMRHHDARDADPETLEGKVVTTADALAHIVTPWYLIKMRYSKKPVPEMLAWCREKLEKDFARIQFRQEQEYARPFYEHWKQILE